MAEVQVGGKLGDLVSALPGGGTVTILTSCPSPSGSQRLYVLEQQRSEARFRWLCSSCAGGPLMVESVVPLAALPAAGAATRGSTAGVGFDRTMLMPAYHEAMVASLGLCAVGLRRACFLGLGGGALALFIAQHHRRCRITCVEQDPGVLALATKFFGVQSGPRLRLHNLAAERFLARYPRGRWEAIFVDATSFQAVSASGEMGFRATAPPPTLSTAEALRQLRERLPCGGVLIINVFGGRRHCARVSHALCAAFSCDGSSSVRRLSGCEVGNTVLVALRGSPDAGTTDRLDEAWLAACTSLGLTVTVESAS